MIRTTRVWLASIVLGSAFAATAVAAPVTYTFQYQITSAEVPSTNDPLPALVGYVGTGTVTLDVDAREAPFNSGGGITTATAQSGCKAKDAGGCIEDFGARGLVVYDIVTPSGAFGSTTNDYYADESLKLTLLANPNIQQSFTSNSQQMFVNSGSYPDGYAGTFRSLQLSLFLDTARNPHNVDPSQFGSYGPMDPAGNNYLTFQYFGYAGNCINDRCRAFFDVPGLEFEAKLLSLTPTVPLPAGVWLLLSGAGALAGVARRRKKTAQ